MCVCSDSVPSLSHAAFFARDSTKNDAPVMEVEGGRFFPLPSWFSISFRIVSQTVSVEFVVRFGSRFPKHPSRAVVVVGLQVFV